MNQPVCTCALTYAVGVISGKWKLYILNDLRNGPKRYGEIRRACTNITEKMLTQQLRELEKDGVVSRKVYPQVPPKVEYSFTELGKKLTFLFDQLAEWGVEYIKLQHPNRIDLLQKPKEQTSEFAKSG